MDDLTERLRGIYPVGIDAEFGYRKFEQPPIMHEAADKIEYMQAKIKELEEDCLILKPEFKKRILRLLALVSNPKLVRQDLSTGDSWVCLSCGGVSRFKEYSLESAHHNPYYCEASEANELYELLKGNKNA